MQVFTRVRGGCDNQGFHNKNPRWEIEPGRCMLSGPEALRILGIWKKKAVSWDSDLGEARRLCALRAPHVGWVSWGLRFDARRRKAIFGARRGKTSCLRRGRTWWRSDGKVSIERNCVSLSSCRKTFKLEKVNKIFLPEPISCFSDSYILMNICKCFPYLYEYVYFTYSYLAM